MLQKIKTETKVKFRKGDKVRVIAGKDKGKEGKILNVDREHNRVTVEGVNMTTKHQKSNQRTRSQGGIITFEGSIHASNVMYLNGGNVTRIGYKFVEAEKNGRTKLAKVRIDKKTEQEID